MDDHPKNEVTIQFPRTHSGIGRNCFIYSCLYVDNVGQMGVHRQGQEEFRSTCLLKILWTARDSANVYIDTIIISTIIISSRL